MYIGVGEEAKEDDPGEQGETDLRFQEMRVPRLGTEPVGSGARKIKWEYLII